MSLKQQVVTLLTANPDLTYKDVMTQTGVSRAYFYEIVEKCDLTYRREEKQYSKWSLMRRKLKSKSSGKGRSALPCNPPIPAGAPKDAGGASLRQPQPNLRASCSQAF